MKTIPKATIWNALLKAETSARSSRLAKFISKPFAYPALLIFDYVIYPRYKKGKVINLKTFFGVSMQTLLPAGTDIALHGIKAHDSEIRLSKFLTLHLKPGTTFIDIGAHYGYYTLLASVLSGEESKIYSIEAAGTAYKLLTENTRSRKNITPFHAAAGNENKELKFYEYPGPLAEYNTLIEDAYVHEKWAKHIKPTVSLIQSIVVDELWRNENIRDAFIKIDVEGGELNVLQGMTHVLAQPDVVIIMEYLQKSGSSKSHHDAAMLLMHAGYLPFVILESGELHPVGDIEKYLTGKNMSSDNIVFKKI